MRQHYETRLRSNRPAPPRISWRRACAIAAEVSPSMRGASTSLTRHARVNREEQPSAPSLQRLSLKRAGAVEWGRMC